MSTVTELMVKMTKLGSANSLSVADLKTKAAAVKYATKGTNLEDQIKLKW